MPFLQELLGGAQKPTAQEMAGGIPQNADPGKAGLLGKGLMGLRGDGGRGSFAPPPVQATPSPDMGNAPAQMMPQGQPIPATAGPPPAMAGMGGPPPMGAGMPMGGAAPAMQNNPAILQALLARQQMGGGR